MYYLDFEMCFCLLLFFMSVLSRHLILYLDFNSLHLPNESSYCEILLISVIIQLLLPKNLMCYQCKFVKHTIQTDFMLLQPNIHFNWSILATLKSCRFNLYTVKNAQYDNLASHQQGESAARSRKLRRMSVISKHNHCSVHLVLFKVYRLETVH